MSSALICTAAARTCSKPTRWCIIQTHVPFARGPPEFISTRGQSSDISLSQNQQKRSCPHPISLTQSKQFKHSSSSRSISELAYSRRVGGSNCNRITISAGARSSSVRASSWTRMYSTAATTARRNSGMVMDFNTLNNNLPDPDLWYVLTAITLTAIGRQHLIGQLWEHLTASWKLESHNQANAEFGATSGASTAISTEMEKEVIRLEKIAVRLREGLMKMSVLFGYPRAINALSTLYKAQQALSKSSSSSSSSPTSITQIHSILLSRLSGSPLTRAYLHPNPPSTATSHNETPSPVAINNYPRGLSLFTKIYSPKHVPTLLHNMSISSSGDLSNFAISRVYGDLLSDLSILDERETGLACFVTCLALALSGGPEELDLEGQIKGHMYGARNLGASGEEIRSAAELVVKVWEGVAGGNSNEVADSVKSVLDKAKEW